jgi:type I restriction enzyme S subunit
MKVKIRNAGISVGIYLAILANIWQQRSRKMTKVQTEINTSTIRNPNSALPEGWRWVRLGDMCEKPQYGYTASAESKPVGPKFLRITDIQDGQVNWDTVPYCSCTAIDIDKYLLKPGDILFARTGGTTGKSYLITEVPEAIFASYLIRVRPCDNLISEFLYLFLQSDIYWRQVEGSKRGGAQPNMNATLLANVSFPLPPLPEQKRIATKVHKLMQKVERARTACEKQLEAAKALPSAYLRYVFESEEAKKWEKKRLGEVCEFRKGRKPITLYEEPREGRFPYILIESFSGAYQKFTDDESCPKCTKEDVLLVWDGARSGLCTKGLDGCIGSTISALHSKSGLYSKYLFWFIRNHYKDLNKMVRGTGIPHLEKEYVHSLAVPLPLLTIQHHIAAELEEKMAQVEKLRLSIDKQLEAINALPQAILRKAFRGEL